MTADLFAFWERSMLLHADHGPKTLCLAAITHAILATTTQEKP